MRWRRADWRPWVIGSLLVSAGAMAAGDGVVQQIPDHGQINWSDKTITARGSGAPSKKAKSPAAARLGAERAAKLDAFRHILETVKGVQVTSTSTGADAMAAAEIKSQVEGVLRGAQVIDTVYYSDLSVDVVLRMPIDGALTEALAPKGGKKVQVPSSGKAKHTGLVINAKGLKLEPAIAPRVVDEKGREIYGVSFVSEKAVLESGIAGYAKDVAKAKQHDRVKDNPLVVRAVDKPRKSNSDLVISNADADKLRDKDSNLGFLADGKVLIVVD